MFCGKCGHEIANTSTKCPYCGEITEPAAYVEPEPVVYNNPGPAATGDKAYWVPAGKDKVVCILLAFFLGGFGIHNFYLGEYKKGTVKLVTCWFGLGGLLALVDLIKMIFDSYTVNPDSFI